MPTIEVTEAQKEYIEDLREELAEHHVGAYGTVRTRDAVQFLVDHHESVAAVEGEAGTGAASDAAGAGPESGDDSETEDPDDAEGSSASGEDAGGSGRLNAMMQLLEEHDDAWEEVDSDQGKYAVTLPDGATEHVRTKDDVRALLFQHYN